MLRHALTTRAGVAAVVALVALAGIPALFGVTGSSAKSVKSAKASSSTAGSTSRQARVLASARQVHTDRIAWPPPFTSFDLFLLVAGGAVLLLFGANVGRPAREGEAATERVGA
jgi:hypothetical protein